jgi:hypothetical protein
MTKEINFLLRVSSATSRREQLLQFPNAYYCILVWQGYVIVHGVVDHVAVAAVC